MKTCKRIIGALIIAALAPVLLVHSQTEAPASNTFDRIAAARERLASIELRSTRVETINELENLQRIFGYYVDKMLWEHVIDLFSDEATLEIGDSGVYIGKDSIRRYLYALSGGEQGPLEGVLFNHLQLQPVITLAEDGRTAKGRWRALVMTGVHGEGSGGNWGEGIYENEYVRERGVWKISRLRWYPTFVAPYEGGWREVHRDAITQYSRPAGVEPDRPPTGDYEPYPASDIAPFHFPHPVTGRAFEERDR